MNESIYFSESNTKKKDSLTSGSLTTGIIITVIVGLLLAAKCIMSAGW